MAKLEKDVSMDNVVHGCFASFLVMALVMLFLSFIFTEWLGLWTAEGEKAVSLGVWLVAICVGGFVAARRSETTAAESFKTALWVGVLATLLVLVRVPKPRDDSLFTEQLRYLLSDPIPHWRHILGLLLTVPAALIGWRIARRRGDHKSVANP